MGKPTRRLSQASSIVASYLRDLVSKDDRQDSEHGIPYLASLSEHSLHLPENQLNGTNLEDSFLTDRRMRRTLEEIGLINWCPGIEYLIPLAVTNDGNTLCHSASLAMWGVHDRQLHLRCLIGKALKGHAEQELRKRWQRQLSRSSRSKLHDVECEQDVETEWQVLIELTSATNKSVRSSNPLYEPLEEFHIFILANVLRRPIIVFAERPIRSAEPEDTSSCFAAVYLPLFWDSKQCCRSPLVVGYCDNYFAPLINFGRFEGNNKSKERYPAVVPLVGIDKIPIEHRYLTEEEEVLKNELLSEYLLTAEIEATGKNQVTHIITVAKLIPNPSTETQNLVSEFFNQPENKDQTQAEPAVKATERQFTRRLSKFKCGNKVCAKFIDQDHLFPYCTECHPKFTSPASKSPPPTRRKMNSANTVVAPTSLEIECATVGCPYFAAVSSFPYCHRCKNGQSTSSTQLPPKNPELILQERWQKLAMGMVDEQLASEMTQINLHDGEQTLFAKLNSRMEMEDGEKCAMGGATSTRSATPLDYQKQTKASATGARSVPQRKVSREELLLATNAIDLGNQEDWKRKISWINEPCARMSCTYYASTRTYPYCNQCATEMQNPTPAVAAAQRRRKVSGTCTLSTLLQED